MHGPPGTGKSQTITNVIGDHLARGQRVLFVCDKRTALDVVRYRLEKVGLGGLCAIVHDPQRDQKNLYMGIRSQLDALPEITPATGAARELKRMLRELKHLHAELTLFDQKVCAKPDKGNSLPVLTRAERVVIAGDPKQLPPTRFFESAVATTADAADASDEQGMV